MARPKRKARTKRIVPKERKQRRSAGGRPPYAIQVENSVRHFKDHTGATYTVVNGPPSWHQGSSFVRKLGIHLCCLDTPDPSPEALALNICSQKLLGDRYDPRVDVYTGFDSIEQCMDHHLREKVFRQKAAEELRRAAVDGMNEEDAYHFLTTQVRGKEPLPHIVPTWCEGIRFWRESNPQVRYKSWILVTKKGCKTWADVQEQGILLVQFDLDWAVEMETCLYDEDPASDSLIPGDKQPWLVIDRVEQPPSITTELLCVRSQPSFDWDDFRKPDGSLDFDEYCEFQKSWVTPGNQGTLSNKWIGFCSALSDCTYRNTSCDGCRDGEPHDRCEWELDEHYFDDEGQCIACRRERDYRRRSKRLANKPTKS